MDKERILLTGITGFIGGELARKLCDEYEVVGLVRTSSNKNCLDPIKDTLSKIRIVYGNLGDFSSIKRIVKEIEPHYIIHVGGSTAVRHSFENPIEFGQVNYLGTVNLVHAALELTYFKKFLYASTMETYGFQKEKTPFKEEMILNPDSPYAVSKVAAERYIEMAGKAFDFPYVILKCCNTFGRKHDIGFIVEYITTQMLKGETVYIGTPDAVRDLMYVDDHVNAYITCLKSDMIKEKFNFSTGTHMTMWELFQKIKELTGFTGEIVKGFPPDYPHRPLVVDYLALDASKAQEKLGWKPQFTVEEGLKKTVEYWKNKNN